MNYKFLIYVGESYGFPIGRPLQAEILSRGYEVAWFNAKKSNDQYLEASEQLLHTVKEVKQYHPDVVLTPTDYVPHFFPGIKVQIFHGFLVNKWSFKRGHFRIRGFYDLYCTQGPSTTVPFLQLKAKHKHFEVTETGWSKVDPLFPIAQKPATERPVILISSTFTDRLSLAKIDTVYEEIKRLAQLGKWQFLCILHPKMETEIVDQFKALANDNFSYFDTTDLVPIFKQADVMLSDTTSAISEFILQEKPVVTFRNNKPDDYMINVLEVPEIEGAIATALQRPPALIAAIKGYIANTHPYSDGRSSMRVIDATIDFVKTKKVKRKPLNLMRKYKMRKLLNYFR